MTNLSGGLKADFPTEALAQRKQGLWKNRCSYSARDTQIIYKLRKQPGGAVQHFLSVEEKIIAFGVSGKRLITHNRKLEVCFP